MVFNWIFNNAQFYILYCYFSIIKLRYLRCFAGTSADNTVGSMSLVTKDLVAIMVPLPMKVTKLVI